MNHKKRTLLVIMFVLAMLVVSGCNPPQTTPCPTSEPQSCPTTMAQTCPTNAALSCPTAVAAKIPTSEYTWSGYLQNESEFIITFDSGGKCSVHATRIYNSGDILYNIKVNDQTHATYAVIFQTLDEGKTLEDLKAYPDTAQDAPSWSHVFLWNYVSAGSNSYNDVVFSKAQIYISCFVSTPTGILRILDYGPVEIK
jgi:hypothetical protein